MITVFIWLLCAFFFLMLELSIPGLFFFLSLFFGCFAGALVALGNQELVVQSLTALFISISTFLLLHYWLKKFFMYKQIAKTNVYALPGRKAYVVNKISFHSPGQVNIDGQIWAAKSLYNQQFIPGDNVQIVYVKGCHVVVRPLQKNNEIS